MGWCSATEIIDAAIAGAEAAVKAVVETIGDPAGAQSFESVVDDALRPFVRTVAAKLTADDWDCQQDSDYFARFPQEMLDLDNKQFVDWIVEQMDGAEGEALAAYSSMLTMALEARDNGR